MHTFKNEIENEMKNVKFLEAVQPSGRNSKRACCQVMAWESGILINISFHNRFNMSQNAFHTQHANNYYLNTSNANKQHRPVMSTYERA